MKLLSPTQSKRLNEVAGILFLSLGLVTLLSLASYHAQDPSWDTASVSRPLNLIGYPGAYLADLIFQAFGAVAFLFPVLVLALAWKWIRSEPIEAGAAKILGAAMLAVEVDPSRIEKRLATGYCDRMTESLDQALVWIDEARASKSALSVGLVGNAADVLPELVARGITPDVVTDQTSAHDMLNGYVPALMSLDEAAALRTSDPAAYIARATRDAVVHVRAMRAMQDRGAIVFDYGNNIRTVAFDAGLADAFTIPGFVPEYIRPLFCEGKGPFRWAALSGDPADIARTDRLALELFPRDTHLRTWIEKAQEHIRFQGLPARICWLGQGDRARFGVAINDLVASGEISAPIVIGRDHLDTGSVASPFRETEGMKDGSDAVADWPILNALLNVASGASWVSFHHGGGVGIGNSLHAGQVIVADGTSEMRVRLERVLTNDPGIGVVRHADAGYETARETARKNGIKMPMDGTAIEDGRSKMEP